MSTPAPPTPPPVQLVECPRDALQGLHAFVPTQCKIEYLNALLRVGFHTLDFGSFVSPKAVPQLADTPEVLAALHDSPTRLLAIVANERGALDALRHERIRYLGYPFSLSETFQQRNTNRGREAAFADVQRIQDHCVQAGRQLVVYLSMGFGNPYGDDWSPNLLVDWAGRMAGLGIGTLSLADTVGSAHPNDIANAFTALIPAHPGIVFGAHFHATPSTWRAKVDAAYTSGCRRFDGALGGYGGCPFAADELTGNIATEHLLAYLAEHETAPPVDGEALLAAQRLVPQVFVATQNAL